MLFRRIVLYALLVGALSGLLMTAVQYWQVIPIIQSAERFEGEHASAPVDEHEGQSASDYERAGLTLLSNVLAAAGFALLILVAIVASRRTHATTRLDWRYGLLWGGAGYAVFFLVPTLGLPPEIPGAAAAPLEARQLWWLFTVVLTATGLAGAAFGKSPWRWAALGLLVVPFLVGAPQPPTAMFADQPPAAAAELTRLARQFIGATAIANAALRSEERRVGKECRSRWSPSH